MQLPVPRGLHTLGSELHTNRKEGVMIKAEKVGGEERLSEEEYKEETFPAEIEPGWSARRVDVRWQLSAWVDGHTQ